MTLNFTPQALTSLLAHCALLCSLSLSATAQTTWSSNAQADTGRQAAQARLDADKKLCADEASPEARLQCRRDAQTLFDKAVSASQPGTYQTPVYGQANCTDCGRVTSVSVAEKASDSNAAVGMIAGGVAGALLGRQVGGGFGTDLATIAGAAGGAYAGKKIQESLGTNKVWTVGVQYTNGRTASFDFAQDPGFSVGDAVKNTGNSVGRN
jgi:uncharacterized protein YcfJ